MNNIYYKNKYLKYKNKYLLKKNELSLISGRRTKQSTNKINVNNTPNFKKLPSLFTQSPSNDKTNISFEVYFEDTKQYFSCIQNYIYILLQKLNNIDTKYKRYNYLFNKKNIASTYILNLQSIKNFIINNILDSKFDNNAKIIGKETILKFIDLIILDLMSTNKPLLNTDYIKYRLNTILMFNFIKNEIDYNKVEISELDRVNPYLLTLGHIYKDK